MFSATAFRNFAHLFILLAALPSLVFAQSTVSLTLDDGSMDEATLGTGSFTVSRDGNTTESINVFVKLTGSAAYNADFTYLNLQGYSHPTWYVNIPAGQNSTTVTLTPVRDNLSEGVETLVFELLPPISGNGDYTIGTEKMAEMTLDDDVAEVILTLDDGDMDEATLGTGSFTVTRDDHGNKDQPINVFVKLTGSAAYNADFTYLNLQGYSHPTWYVNIPAGQNSTTVTLTPVRDNLSEGVETLVFELLPPISGNGDYTIGTEKMAEMTLDDDVAEVILTLDDGDMDEATLGTGSFTVTRDDHGNKDQPINVFVKLTGSAAYNADFTYLNLQGYSHPTWYVNIPAGQNSTTVTLTPVRDNLSEGVETLVFELLPPISGNGDYTIGTEKMAEMTLDDDVAEVILTLDDGDMDEATLGTGSFTVTRDDHGNKDQPINVFVKLTGSAAYNADFTYLNLQGYSHPTWYVNIPAGQNSTTVTLTPVRDNLSEGVETLVFELLPPISGNGDYTIGTEKMAEMTLDDDVAEVILTLDDGDMDEATLGTGSFTVTRDDHGNKDQPINVFVKLTGSAAYNADFTYLNLQGYSHPTWYVNIPAGQNSTMVTLTPVRDSIIEGDESLIFTLLPSVTNQGDYIVGTSTTAEMTIFDLVDRMFSDSFED